MQRCFIEETPLASPDGRALLDTINGLIHTCREAGVLVAHTRGWMAKDRSNLGVMAELVPPFVVELYTEGSPTAELHEALDVAPEDLIINKARYGAFHGTDLARQLRERGIESVIISGIATNICCETTACEASQHDFRVVFLSDGTATREMNGVPAEELQRATLASPRHGVHADRHGRGGHRTDFGHPSPPASPAAANRRFVTEPNGCT